MLQSYEYGCTFNLTPQRGLKGKNMKEQRGFGFYTLHLYHSAGNSQSLHWSNVISTHTYLRVRLLKVPEELVRRVSFFYIYNVVIYFLGKTSFLLPQEYLPLNTLFRYLKSQFSKLAAALKIAAIGVYGHLLL